jgi:hypothetical protein
LLASLSFRNPNSNAIDSSLQGVKRMGNQAGWDLPPLSARRHSSYRGASLIGNRPHPLDHHRALGVALL